MKTQLKITNATLEATPLEIEIPIMKSGLFNFWKSLSLASRVAQNIGSSQQTDIQEETTMQEEPYNTTDSQVSSFDVPITITFVKKNGLSMGKYGDVCLPKPIYKQLHAVWGKKKTEGTCAIGGSSFNCYIAWNKSKSVWMLRLRDAKLTILELGVNAKLTFQLEINTVSFNISINAPARAGQTVSCTNQVKPIAQRNTILSFEEARKYVRALGLKSMQDWISYSKSGYRPKFIPSNPWIAYKGDYLSINDFIGGKSPRRTTTGTVTGAGQ